MCSFNPLHNRFRRCAQAACRLVALAFQLARDGQPGAAARLLIQMAWAFILNFLRAVYAGGKAIRSYLNHQPNHR